MVGTWSKKWPCLAPCTGDKKPLFIARETGPVSQLSSILPVCQGPRPRVKCPKRCRVSSPKHFHINNAWFSWWMIYHEKRVCQFLEKVPRSGNTDTCLHISISNVFTFMNSISIYGQLKVWIDIVYGRLRLFGPPVYLRGSGEGRGRHLHVLQDPDISEDLYGLSCGDKTHNGPSQTLFRNLHSWN